MSYTSNRFKNPCTVTKRSGEIVSFDMSRIKQAIQAADESVVENHIDDLDGITDKVCDRLSREDVMHVTVEHVQDTVEHVLIDNHYHDVAKSYILYRDQQDRIRKEKMSILNTDRIGDVSKSWSINALRVLAARYLFRDKNNKINETPEQLVKRIAIHIALATLPYHHNIYDKLGKQEKRTYDNDKPQECWVGDYKINKYHYQALARLFNILSSAGHMRVSWHEFTKRFGMERYTDDFDSTVQRYYDLMKNQMFLPNSPTIMNAGGRLGQLSACFVLDMPDDLGKMMDTTKTAALIFKSGGGVGINYSDVRHKGDTVSSTFGVASGPISFMNIINTMTDTIKQGGKRRGANMGILESWHPDIEEFIKAKNTPGVLENFNVSVGVCDDFMKCLESDEPYPLKSPRTGDTIKKIDTRRLLDQISSSAWNSAEPGLIFLDSVNLHNVLHLARGKWLRATNPCGEQSLYENESCNLGSINLAKMVTRDDATGKYEFNWDLYRETILTTTEFLDGVVDMNNYPTDEITKASRETRRIGLGVMGLADLLYLLEIPYNSQESYELQSQLAEALTYYSMMKSITLSDKRGKFGLYDNTWYKTGGMSLSTSGRFHDAKYDWKYLRNGMSHYGMRNVLTTTVAPTGTLAMLADCSNGIEPNFALAYEKHVSVGKFNYTNRILRDALTQLGYDNDTIDGITNKIIDNYGSVQNLDKVPKSIQDIFVTAMDIHWSDHIMAQAVWQDWIGNAISKTINLPYDASVNDVKAAYLMAHDMGLKGITVYRDGSRQTQVLHMADDESTKTYTARPSRTILDYVSNYNVEGKPHTYCIISKAVISDLQDLINLRNLNSSTKNNNMPEPDKHTHTQAHTACPSCKEKSLVFSGGCETCHNCGYSACSVS